MTRPTVRTTMPALTPADLPTEPGEEWRDLPTHPGLYAVSSHGRVARLARGTRTRPGDVLAGHIHRIHGYRIVQLTDPRASIPVHRLVWRAFRGLVPAGLRITHANDNMTDDRLANLVLRSYSAQTTALYAAGKGPRLRGRANPNGALDDAQIAEIAATQGRETAKAVAVRYGVGKSTVDKIRRGVYRPPRTP